MLDAWITQWRTQSLPVEFLVAYLLQVIMYVGAAGEIALAYGVMRRYLKIGALIDSRPLQYKQVRHEVGRSLMVCSVYAATTLLYLNYSSALWPTAWTQALMQIIGFLLLNDFCAYWTHRLLHTRRFANFHRAHHDFTRVTPWSALSLHPVEAVLNQLPYLLFIGVLASTEMPMGIGTLLGLQLILMIGAANSHSNYNPLTKLDGWPALKRQTLFHQYHHRYGRDNYGYMGPHWDYVFGTSALAANSSGC